MARRWAKREMVDPHRSAAGCACGVFAQRRRPFLGTGLVKGVKSDRDTLAVATQPAVDSFTFRLTRDIRDSLRPELLSLLAAAGDTAKLKADSLGQGDRGPAPGGGCEGAAGFALAPGDQHQRRAS